MTLTPALAQDEAPKTTRDGVYTVEQAGRGQETYAQVCAACHPLDWYKGDSMKKSWEGATLLGLYESIATTMPQSNPGSLKPREVRFPPRLHPFLERNARGQRRSTRHPRRSRQDRHHVEEEAMIRGTHRRPILATSALLATLGLVGAPAFAQTKGTEKGEWRYWGGDERSSRYSPLDQINAQNAGKLEVAWRWLASNYGPEPDFIYRGTPIKVGDRLYNVAGQRRTVVSIDPATGETLWMWRMRDNPRWEASTRKNYGKGVAYAEVEGRPVIFTITPGYYLVALDADTGHLLPNFGLGGIVDLHLGLGNYPVDPDRGTLDSGDITASSPPIVVNGVVVVGNSHDRGYYPERKENIPGHVRGYDAKTGQMLWRFHVLPQPGEAGHDTWEGDSWTYTGNISAWAPLSADSERGLVFIPTDTPTNDYYGGHRGGANLYGTSLIALDAKTGKRVWHFQMVHHDIWNYDNPDAPHLVDITVGGRKIPAVAAVTKQGFTYVFNRETGQPVWPIEERKVPQSDAPGEKTWPTQPFPTKPAAFELQGITDDDLIDFTPELRQQAKEIAHQYRMGPLFLPPSLWAAPDGSKGAFNVPGANGGANIPGEPRSTSRRACSTWPRSADTACSRSSPATSGARPSAARTRTWTTSREGRAASADPRACPS